MMFVPFSLCLSLLAISGAVHADLPDSTWPVIHEAFFAGKTVQEGGAVLALEAPVQAEDPSLVPFSFRAVAPAGDALRHAYLITDGNPIQLTAVFHFPDGVQHTEISTRIRLDKNSLVRVVTETRSGQFHMSKVAIRTPGGGCGGGVSADEAKLRQSSGRMKLHATDAGTSPEVIFHIRHPMRTGFERTAMGYYAKAWFINRLDFSRADEPLLGVDVGPGISADPYFRFTSPIPLRGEIAVRATDNEGRAYHEKWDAPHLPDADEVGLQKK